MLRGPTSSIYTHHASVSHVDAWRMRLVPLHGKPIDIQVKVVGGISDELRRHLASLLLFIGAVSRPHIVQRLKSQVLEPGGARFGKRIRVLPDGLEVRRWFGRKKLIPWDAVVGPVVKPQWLVFASLPRIAVRYRDASSVERVLPLAYVNRMPNLGILWDQLEYRALTFAPRT
jgi:hypothetical protein